MKAMEYYKSFITDDSDEALRFSKIAHEMLYEMQGMIAIRKPKRKSAFISIFKEQNDKWKAFIKMVDDCKLIDPESFLIDFMRISHERLYYSWKTIGAIE